VHRQEEREGEGTPERNTSAGGKLRPQLIDPPTHTGWKEKEEKRKQLRNKIKLNIS
jgi:hypothetical protein